MELLEGAVRDYAWGSPTGIPEILGRAPDGSPVAEYWLGAHPQAPAVIGSGGHRGTTLDALIAREPARLLGTGTVERFGARVPFLLKLLSARTALSIQAHPTCAQARAGFAAEESAGIPLDAPERSFKDEWHKPELLYALTEFDALCGFRTLAAVRATVERLSAGAASILPPRLASALAAWRETVRPLPGRTDGARTEEAERTALAGSLALVLGDTTTFGALADALAHAELSEVGRGHPSHAGSSVDPLRTLRETNRDFPADPGALVALMLRRFRLRPGEALPLDPGMMHAYLGGLAVEIMASSDNVLRGGLTSKHVDVEELMRITRFGTAAPAVLVPDSAGELRGDADDFVLTVIDRRAGNGDHGGRAPDILTRTGPLVLLSTEGPVTVASAAQELALAGGQAAFVGADEPRPAVSGTGLVFAASTAL